MISSSFAELNIALSGMYTAQNNLAVNMHNISNSAVDGYSRQYALQRANTPYRGYGGAGMVGTGSEVYGIKQHRSIFLDKKYWQQTSVLGQFNSKNVQLEILETGFGALSESGLTTTIDDFFSTLQELSANPGDSTSRNNTISSAQSLIEQIQLMGSELQNQQSDINQEVKIMTETINSIGRQIASLNSQIKLSEINGASANDLRDERNRLVDDLSKYVNVTVTETQRNDKYDAENIMGGGNDLVFNLQINGNDFVKGKEINELFVQERTTSEKLNEMDVEGLYNIFFSNSKTKLDIYSSTLEGELKGLIDVRDGNNGNITMMYDDASGGLIKYEDVISTDINSEEYKNFKNNGYLTSNTYKGLPHYMNKMNAFLRTFAASFNEGVKFQENQFKTTVPNDKVAGHINSFDAYGNNGNLFFSYKDEVTGDVQTNGAIGDYRNLTFNSIVINPDLVNDPMKLACSLADNADESEASSVLQYIDMKSDKSLFKEGTLNSYIVAMTGELGITRQQAVKFSKSYTDLQATIDNQRMSVSGVDLSEETIYLTRNQQLYEASAKLVSVINNIYATCINLGL